MARMVDPITGPRWRRTTLVPLFCAPFANVIPTLFQHADYGPLELRFWNKRDIPYGRKRSNVSGMCGSKITAWRYVPAKNDEAGLR